MKNAEKTADSETSAGYGLSERALITVSKVNFEGKRVLCIGCGGGEEIAFALKRGAAFCTGVDVSKAAIDTAKEFLLAAHLLTDQVRLVCSDAAALTEEAVKKGKDGTVSAYDIVLMLDFLEYVPRDKTAVLLGMLPGLLSDIGVLVIQTPAYKYDNDVNAVGLDERNTENYDNVRDTDSAAESLRCNKFTTVSLQAHLTSCGFLPVTEAHFFIKAGGAGDDFGKVSYYQRWNRCLRRGVPIQGEYADDAIEYPYTDAPGTEWICFTEGDLAGIRLLTTKEYCKIAYPNGQIDQEAITELQEFVKNKESIHVFDIGGFVGANSLVYSKLIGKSGRVVVFEPNPFNRNRIFTNLSHNTELEGTIVVEPYALGGSEGSTSMVLSSDIDNGYSSTSRISEAHSKISDSRLPRGFVRQTVDITTLESYVEKSGIIPNVIKIDVEGAEVMVLQGALNMMRRYKPLFFIEYHSEFCATMCTQLLLSSGYQIYPCKEEEDNRLIIKAVYPARSDSSGGEAQEISPECLQYISNLIMISREQASNNAYLLGEMRRLKELEARIKLLSNELKSIKESKTWKLTAPIRKAGRAFKAK